MKASKKDAFFIWKKKVKTVLKYLFILEISHE